MAELNQPFSHNAGHKHARELTTKYYPREQLLRPSLIDQSETREDTEKIINTIVDEKTQISQKATANQIKTTAGSKFVHYMPKDGLTRLIKVQDVQEDPFCPPQYKNKRIPHGPKGTPDVLLRPPPKKLTQEDQLNWKIPPCISNSKNSRGFVLPLEMRISADGRNSYDPKINEKFVEFSSALYDAEKLARRELEEKHRIKQTLAYEELKKKEEELRYEVDETKKEKESIFGLSHIASNIESGIHSVKGVDDESLAESQRDLLRYMVKKNVEREARLERVGSHKLKEIRERERDITEKVALGQNIDLNHGTGLEVDERVIGLGAGINSGFKGEDVYDVYDKPLFHEAIKTNIYTGAKEFEENHFSDTLEKRNNSRVDKDSHKSRVLKRNKPVEFEKYMPDN